MRFSLNKLRRGDAVNFDLLPLECLHPGEWAEVRDVSGEPDWIGRLSELGVRTGVRIQMLRGGCPCLIRVGGGRLSLRGEHSAGVLVRLEGAI